VLVLRLQVQPRAREDAIVGPHGSRLRVRIKAPPVDGAANTHLQAFLAVICGVPRAQVEVSAGTSSRAKTVRVSSPTTLPPGVLR
jgi:uncharacterized protein (TIGR00251 family)